MSFELTERALAASNQTSIKPQILLEIEGLDTVFSAVIVKKFIKIGDPGLSIGIAIAGESEVWKIGGQTAVEDQSDLISFSQGTSTEIRQSLNIDKGTGESVSSVQIALVDKNLEVTKLITPGNQITELLGVRCKLWLGFEGTSFKNDFIVIFRGLVDDIVSSSGLIKINLAHPDQKKRSKLFTKVDTLLDGTISAGVTSMTVDDTSAFTIPPTDSSLKTYVRIDDEIIRYTGITATTFLGLARGELGTTAAVHDDDSNIESFLRLEGNSIDLALKLMLSGTTGAFATAVDITHFRTIDATTNLTNALFFQGIDIFQEHGIVTGDTVTTTGAANAGNNFVTRTITDIARTELGSYLIVDGAALVTENDTAAILSFFSQYNTLGSGNGLSIKPDEVDIKEHLSVQSLFLSSFDYDIYIKDTIDGRTFISEELYNPASAFSIPRKSQASVGVHTPPLPTVLIPTLDQTNVTNPSKLSIRRTINKNFFNTVVYRFEDDPLEDKFNNVNITQDGTSITRIPVGNKALEINSKGMRTGLSAVANANSAANRRLSKFRFGAEEIIGINVLFSTGYSLEIGDLVILDLTSLQLSDIQSGTRAGESRLFQVTNRKINFRNGQISIDIVDTNFDKDIRYGLLSPSSQVKSGASTTVFTIEQAFASEFGANEFKKWTGFIGASVVVRNPAFSISGVSTILAINGNQITVASTLGFIPLAGYIMEMDDYDNQTDDVKLTYTFMRDSAFTDGKVQYSML